MPVMKAAVVQAHRPSSDHLPAQEPVAVLLTKKSDISRPKSVVFFDHTALLGGGEIALLNLTEALNSQLYRPLVVLAEIGPLQERLAQAGIATHLLPLSPDVVNARKDTLGGSSLLRVRTILTTLAYVLQLARYLRRVKPDLVHTNSLKSDLIGGVAARLAGIPVIWHVRDRITDDYLPPRVAHVFRWLCRIIPQYVLTNSQATLETLLPPTENVTTGTAEGERERFWVVHDGIRRAEDSAPDYVMNTDAPLIGLVGRISPWKGQHIFVEAAAQVRERFPNARFQIIGAALFGEREYEAQVRARATELGLDDCLHWLGFRSDVDALIGKLDILVHASTTGEPFGQVVIEGMAQARPVVATRGGGVPEIVQEGESGLLVTMGSVEEMAEAVVALLSDPERARSMGLAGWERVRSQFTIQRTAQEVEAVYDRLLYRAPARKQSG